jgi:hypothetical protein
MHETLRSVDRIERPESRTARRAIADPSPDLFERGIRDDLTNDLHGDRGELAVAVTRCRVLFGDQRNVRKHTRETLSDNGLNREVGDRNR